MQVWTIYMPAPIPDNLVLNNTKRMSTNKEKITLYPFQADKQWKILAQKVHPIVENTSFIFPEDCLRLCKPGFYCQARKLMANLYRKKYNSNL